MKGKSLNWVSGGRVRRPDLLAWAVGLAAAFVLAGCLNPFAPGLDTSPGESSCDQHSIDGIFRCFQSSYTFRDTTLYGQLLDPNFVFVYRDYELGIDVSWGREEDMRTTYGLFQNAQKLDLIWNNVISSASDSNSVTVVRGFTLTLVFNPSDIEDIYGLASLTFERAQVTDPWKIVRWRDESQY
ncbi:MAG TPA: hypothetical protein VF889_02245 [Bacteroidota bacterium]